MLEYGVSSRDSVASVWDRDVHGEYTLMMDDAHNADSDVTFIVRGEKIKAHEGILMARSSHFDNLFGSETEGKRN